MKKSCVGGGEITILCKLHYLQIFFKVEKNIILSKTRCFIVWSAMYFRFFQIKSTKVNVEVDFGRLMFSETRCGSQTNQSNDFTYSTSNDTDFVISPD